ncbi:putative porin [Crocinitomicaceae bacterium]|nr:putative porin [Crocinitomicaceae bacterium]
MQNWFRFIVFFFPVIVYGQAKLYTPELDSINQSYRAGGVSLDSTDAINVGQQNLRSAGGFGETIELNLSKQIASSPSLFSYLNYRRKANILFTGLPHLGFQYAFGSYGNQALNAEFHQFYRPQTHLHVNLHRVTSNGALRSSNFTLSDVNVQFFHQNKRYATHIDAYYGSYNYAENRGVESDSLLPVFPIEFIPVQVSGAVEIRKVDVNWRNYYRLLGDSLLGQGIKFQSCYELSGRVYEEQDFLGLNYDNIYIDTFNTRDQHQTASLKNGGGYYFSSKYFQIDATLNHRLWRYQNLGQFRDTNEVFVHSNLWLKLGDFQLRNKFFLNTLGALGELSNLTNASVNVADKFQVSGRLLFENRMPIPHQRFYAGNNVQWKLNALKAQQIVNIGGQAAYGDSNKVIAQLDWTNVANGLYFINNIWRQDTLGLITVGALSLKGELHVGSFHLYPSLTLRFNTNNFAFQPNFSTRNRLVYKTKLFKTKRLIFALGADVGYDTEYNHFTYNNLTGTLDPNSSVFITPSMMRVNMFTAFQISQFRFFIRAENVDYFWNPETYRIDPNFPIMPFFIRVGLSWDFFN